MARLWTRRAMLASMAAAAHAADEIPSQVQRYRDPLTEFDLLRLTDPAKSNCVLPPAPNRAVRRDALIYSSDAGGTNQVYRMNLRSGVSSPLTNAAQLDVRAVSLLADNRSVCYRDGDTIAVAGGRTRTLYRPDSGWQSADAFAVAEDGDHAIVSESNGAGKWRVRLVNLVREGASTVAESSSSITGVAPRPRRAGILYFREDSLWLVGYDGTDNRRLRTPPGRITSALWSGDGRSIYYVCARETPRRIYEMRECIPDTNEDKSVAITTEFVSFARNADSSVFCGVSGSRGAPYLLILLRAAKRELTIAEHKASEARHVGVQFSTNSQRVFYSTDRQGKAAIYSIDLARFIENTEPEAAYCTQPDAPDAVAFRAV